MRALLSSMFSGGRRRAEAEQLLDAITAQAREPVFYEAFAVPDTLDGRFDLMTVHAWMVFRAMRGRGRAAAQLAQLTTDMMFTAFDDAIRSLGVGDMGVPRRVKAMARAYFGRSESYGAAYNAGGGATMADALKRNLYRGLPPATVVLSGLADYVTSETRRLEALTIDAFHRSNLGFTPPDAPPAP